MSTRHHSISTCATLFLAARRLAPLKRHTTEAHVIDARNSKVKISILIGSTFILQFRPQCDLHESAQLLNGLARRECLKKLYVHFRVIEEIELL